MADGPTGTLAVGAEISSLPVRTNLFLGLSATKDIHYQPLSTVPEMSITSERNSLPEIAKCLATISHRLQFYFLNPPPVEFLATSAVNDVFPDRVGYFLIRWLREPESAAEDQSIYFAVL
jgi:hypothetical protein